MQKLISGGAAVVLVSHDLIAVRRLATKAIWIDAGRVMQYGEVEKVTTEYENSFQG
jgi:ABC-2 type transport system ATP-binding protein